MPIYEYQCSQCSHRFEIIQGMRELGDMVICPQCGNKKTDRLVSSFSCGGRKGEASESAASCGPRPGRLS